MVTREAAELAGVSVPTVWRWCRRGVVAAEKISGRWIINAASLVRRVKIGEELAEARRRRRAKPQAGQDAPPSAGARWRAEFRKRRAKFADGSGRPWVAQITGLSARYGYRREFLDGQLDYAADRPALSWQLEAGEVYQVGTPTWSGMDRRYVTVRDGRVVRIGEKEVRAWLAESLNVAWASAS